MENSREKRTEKESGAEETEMVAGTSELADVSSFIRK